MCAGENGEQLHGGGHLALDDVERAALAVPVVGVDAGAHHEFTLVRLRDVDVHRIRHHDRRVHRLEQFGHQRLKGMALQRRADAEHVGQCRGVPGRAQRDLSGGDVTLVVRTPVTRSPSVTNPVTSQFWMMSIPASSARRAKPQAT